MPDDTQSGQAKTGVLALLGEMSPDERQAIYATWEAQQPLRELAVTTPPLRFVSCWLAARDYYQARA